VPNKDIYTLTVKVLIVNINRPGHNKDLYTGKKWAALYAVCYAVCMVMVVYPGTIQYNIGRIGIGNVQY
jgi:hypothetical protein